MGWGRVEWYGHMGMTYLTSLDPQLFLQIEHMLGLSSSFC